MNIAVIGATGLVGSAAVSELAARGHQVTAIARNAAKVAQHPNVTAVSADVNAPDFADKISGFDAVVSAFSAGWDNPNLAADTQTAYANIGYTDLMVDGAPSPHQSDTTLRWLIDRLRS